ncbi:PH domain-containing protein [Nocardiopsis sp. LOL_012]|uniref:PH domain-containing protein n=1 Tax=Nocardiopsis sp. LOL_012 TaxID=3345409 RepID=UPI003A89AC74
MGDVLMERPGSTTYAVTFTRVMAALWTAVALLLLVEVLLAGRGRSAWIAGAVLVVSIAVVYLVWLRPRLVATERGLRVVNPVRETFVPWSAVVWVDVTDVLRVHTPDRIVRSWPLRETRRSRVRDNLRRTSGLVDPEAGAGDAPQRPMDRIAAELRGEAEHRKARPLSGPIRDVAEAGPAALGAGDRPQSMVPVEVFAVLAVTAAAIAGVLVFVPGG